MSQAINRDIMEWQAFPDYDMLYTDPPWGERMVKFFQTMERKQTGNSHNNNLLLILNQLGRLANAQKPMVIEYAVKDWEIIPETLSKYGHIMLNQFEAMQSMGRPFIIMEFNRTIGIDRKLKGFDLVEDAVTKSGAKTVFDPFAGIGQTAKAVHRAGAEYIGSELNAERYARLKKIVDAHNQK